MGFQSWKKIDDQLYSNISCTETHRTGHDYTVINVLIPQIDANTTTTKPLTIYHFSP